MKEIFENNFKRNYVITKRLFGIRQQVSVRVGVMAESEERASSPMLDVETEPAS